jgi:alpha-beta hydrolase superfamily lysophospholipase
MKSEELKDPLFYSGKLRIGTGLSLMRAVEALQSRLSLVTLPFLLQHGTADRVCEIRVTISPLFDKSKFIYLWRHSLQGAELLLMQAQSTDKELLRYDGAQHDLQHDPVHFQKLRDDRMAWLKRRL